MKKCLCSLLLLLPITATSTHAVLFEITFENIGPNVLTPAPFITHNAGFDFFDNGQAASSQLEMLAEDGVPTGVVDLATASLGTTVSDVQVAGGGPLTPGTSATVRVNTSAAHPFLSFASMLAASNDAFLGVATGDGAFDLFAGGIPFNGVIVLDDSDVWDAGTEVNDELSTSVPALGAAFNAGTPEGSVITIPHPGLTGIGDLPLSFNWIDGPVGRITISVVPTPEPITGALGLISLGALGLASRRRVLA